ncbi:MAG: HAMP domain-containing sensor histidine kinase [Wenzhouxiangellaceae bacterium]
MRNVNLGAAVQEGARRWRKLRRRFHARSVLALLSFCFLLVTTPLVAGLLVSNAQIDRVIRESEALLEWAVGTTQATREAQDRLFAVERAARQYRVLRDLEASATFHRQLRAFEQHIEKFRNLPVQQSMLESVDQLDGRMAEVADRVRDDRSTEEWPPTLSAGFRELDGKTRDLVGESEAAARRALTELAELGDTTRLASMVQLALVVAFAVALALIFTNLINRPIRTLNRGIRALANPEAGPIPQVSSPRDLRALSVRLEWARRRLARTERDRQRLIGQVSHELKTPLSAIREGISLLDDRVLGELSREHGEIISIIKANVDRLQEQITGLLRYNRMQTGLKPIDFEPVDVSELIEGVVSDHEFAIAARGIRVALDTCGPVQVSGDRDMLRTAIDNLFSNALKYSPEGQTIGIFVTCNNDSVSIEVADCGPGIRPLDRHRLFEPFFRGQGSSNIGVPGSGLGLAICRDLIRMHHGEVDLHERQGWSTIFRASLPRLRSSTH